MILISNDFCITDICIIVTHTMYYKPLLHAPGSCSTGRTGLWSPVQLLSERVFSRQSSAEGVSVSVSPAASSRRLHVSLHRPAPGRGLCPVSGSCCCCCSQISECSSVSAGEPGSAHGAAPHSLSPARKVQSVRGPPFF